MKKVIAIGGSNSKNSINKTLAAYAANSIQHIQGADRIGINTFHFVETEFTKFCEGLMK